MNNGDIYYISTETYYAYREMNPFIQVRLGSVRMVNGSKLYFKIFPGEVDTTDMIRHGKKEYGKGWYIGETIELQAGTITYYIADFRSFFYVSLEHKSDLMASIVMLKKPDSRTFNYYKLSYDKYRWNYKKEINNDGCVEVFCDSGDPVSIDTRFLLRPTNRQVRDALY